MNISRVYEDLRILLVDYRYPRPAKLGIERAREFDLGHRSELVVDPFDVRIGYDLDQPNAPPRTFAADHDTPDGMAWSPERVAALENR